MGGCSVFLLVAPCLVIDVGMDFAQGAYDGAAPTTRHKSRCHIVKGLSRRSSSELDFGSTSPKITSSHCMHESTADPYASSFFEFLQIGVTEPDAVLESQPTIPAVIVLLMSAFGDSLVPGHLCAIDATQEIISGGGVTVLIWDGERDG